MDKFWEQFRESTVTSGILAVGIAATCCYLAIQGIEPPGYLIVALGSIIGFFFGAKAKRAEHSVEKEA